MRCMAVGLLLFSASWYWTIAVVLAYFAIDVLWSLYDFYHQEARNRPRLDLGTFFFSIMVGIAAGFPTSMDDKQLVRLFTLSLAVCVSMTLASMVLEFQNTDRLTSGHIAALGAVFAAAMVIKCVAYVYSVLPHSFSNTTRPGFSVFSLSADAMPVHLRARRKPQVHLLGKVTTGDLEALERTRQKAHALELLS
jgi:hypothetical protein